MITENTVFSALKEFFGQWGNTEIWLVACFGAGAIAASVLSVLQKAKSGKLVRCLLKAQAESAETAKTPRELGLGRGQCGNLKKPDGVLRHVVSTVQTEKNCPAEEIPCYIAPQHRERAKKQYGGSGAEWLWVPVTAVAAVLLCVLLIWLMPYLSEFASGLFS